MSSNHDFRSITLRHLRVIAALADLKLVALAPSRIGLRSIVTHPPLLKDSAAQDAQPMRTAV